VYLTSNAQIRIGLWEPAINLSPAQKSCIFNNSKEKLNGIDDDKNGIADDIFGVTFTDSGYLTGNASLLKNNNNLTEHGWAVYQVLTQSLSNFKIIHAGFTPLYEYNQTIFKISRP
jgi:hypothetical protein